MYVGQLTLFPMEMLILNPPQIGRCFRMQKNSTATLLYTSVLNPLLRNDVKWSDTH